MILRPLNLPVDPGLVSTGSTYSLPVLTLLTPMMIRSLSRRRILHRAMQLVLVIQNFERNEDVSLAVNHMNNKYTIDQSYLSGITVPKLVASSEDMSREIPGEKPKVSHKSGQMERIRWKDLADTQDEYMSNHSRSLTVTVVGDQFKSPARLPLVQARDGQCAAGWHQGR